MVTIAAMVVTVNKLQTLREGYNKEVISCLWGVKVELSFESCVVHQVDKGMWGIVTKEAEFTNV